MKRRLCAREIGVAQLLGLLFDLSRRLGVHVADAESNQVAREFLEEIGQVLTEVRLLGVLENIFGWQGEPQHEVVFIFTASLADEAAYEIAEQPILDNAGRRVIWRAADAVSPPLYPAGLSELIASG